MSEFLTVEELKPGDLLIQTYPLFEGESKFIIVIEVLPDSIEHCHINKDIKSISKVSRRNTCSISNVRKPYKSELTEEIMKQYKRTLMKLILKRII